MRRTLLPLLATVLVAAPWCVGSAAAYPVAHVNQEPHEKVIRYWTPERMSQALPLQRDSRPLPAAKPQKGGGGVSTSAGVSSEVPQPYPSAFGKVFFTSNSGVNYVCSGAAVLSANESVVWTAGHCVNEGPGAFYKNFLFVPAYRDGSAPYGKFAGLTLLTTSGWQASGESMQARPWSASTTLVRLCPTRSTRRPSHSGLREASHTKSTATPRPRSSTASGCASARRVG